MAERFSKARVVATEETCLNASEARGGSSELTLECGAAGSIVAIGDACRTNALETDCLELVKSRDGGAPDSGTDSSKAGDTGGARSYSCDAQPDSQQALQPYCPCQLYTTVPPVSVKACRQAGPKDCCWQIDELVPGGPGSCRCDYYKETNGFTFDPSKTCEPSVTTLVDGASKSVPSTSFAEAGPRQ